MRSLLLALAFVLLASRVQADETVAGRFRVGFAHANAADGARIASLLERADQELTPWIGEGAPPWIAVLVLPSNNVASMRINGGGSTSPTGVIFLEPRLYHLREGLLFPAIEHEAVHAMLGPRFNNRQPRWLVEGVAEWLSGDERNSGGASALETFASLEQVSQALAEAHTPPSRRAAAYRRSWEEVDRLAKEYGGEAVCAWLRALRTNRFAKVGPPRVLGDFPEGISASTYT